MHFYDFIFATLEYLFEFVFSMDFKTLKEIIEPIVLILTLLVMAITLWKLVSRDKKREEEIASLSNIAKSLTKSQQENEKWYVVKQKPVIKWILVKNGLREKNSQCIEITAINLNPKTTIIYYKIDEKLVEYWDGRMSKEKNIEPLLEIKKIDPGPLMNKAEIQIMIIPIHLEAKIITKYLPYSIEISILYITDEDFNYTQKVTIHINKSKYAGDDIGRLDTPPTGILISPEPIRILK